MNKQCLEVDEKTLENANIANDITDALNRQKQLQKKLVTRLILRDAPVLIIQTILMPVCQEVGFSPLLLPPLDFFLPFLASLRVSLTQLLSLYHPLDFPFIYFPDLRQFLICLPAVDLCCLKKYIYLRFRFCQFPFALFLYSFLLFSFNLFVYTFFVYFVCF